MSFESSKIPAVESEDTADRSHTFKMALFCTALYSVTPGAAKAWENIPLIDSERLEVVLEGIDFPKLTNLPGEITHFIESKNGQYVVQIRQAHEEVNLAPSEVSLEAVTKTATVQRNIRDIIQAIVDNRPYTTFYQEGYRQPDTALFRSDKKLYNKILTGAAILHKDNWQKFSLDSVQTFMSSLSSNGLTLPPLQKSLMAAQLMEILENSSAPRDVEIEAFLKSLIRTPYIVPSDVVLYKEGALYESFVKGYVQDIRGCEDPGAFGASLLSGEELERAIVAINKARETYAVDCISDELAA